ncbi:MAG: zinc ribbon domain-containing protein [Ignavibacteriales bacterium]|nr:zinc ribbon domain-containing protein [Ignavibacteriales bacterium]
MPTYDYKCTKCGYLFEQFQQMTEKPLENCPLCKGKLKRLIGAGAGPIFKGSGFYQTDYKSKPKVDSSQIKDSKAEKK